MKWLLFLAIVGYGLYYVYTSDNATEWKQTLQEFLNGDFSDEIQGLLDKRGELMQQIEKMQQSLESNVDKGTDLYQRTAASVTTLSAEIAAINESIARIQLALQLEIDPDDVDSSAARSQAQVIATQSEEAILQSVEAETAPLENSTPGSSVRVILPHSLS
ncbi:hypothetical protein H6771_00145 [Candidatus Peribacteria bacterium]|nr:hypothetical protein [Candidatus Peribacteria bacterium]